MRKRELRKTFYIISGYTILVTLFFGGIGVLTWLVGFRTFCLIAGITASVTFIVIFAIALIEEGRDEENISNDNSDFEFIDLTDDSESRC